LENVKHQDCFLSPPGSVLVGDLATYLGNLALYVVIYCTPTSATATDN